MEPNFVLYRGRGRAARKDSGCSKNYSSAGNGGYKAKRGGLASYSNRALAVGAITNQLQQSESSTYYRGVVSV
jgi:hypothetical protein